MDIETTGKDLIQQEEEKRDRDLRKLEETEGWQKLTDRQQRIIKTSLYIQQRAERGTDPASKALIVSPKTHVTEHVKILPKAQLEHLYKLYGDSQFDEKKRKYKFSQNYIADWYCFTSIANLENEQEISEQVVDLPLDFFDGNYTYPHTEEVLKSELRKHGFPCVVHIGLEPDSKSLYDYRHTFLALGPDSAGNIVTWDKMGEIYPYSVRNLGKIYDEYNNNKRMENQYYWGVRELRNTSQKE